MSDSSEVDAAVIAALTNDATLAALMTDGVWRDVAPQSKTKFVVVAQQDHVDRYVQTTAAYEEFVYLVKAVDANVSGSTVKTAAARIHTVLQDAALTITGYGLMLIERIERVAFTETDPDQQDRRWQHRGGLYRVFVQPS